MNLISDIDSIEKLVSEIVTAQPDATAIGLTDGSRIFSFRQLQRNVEIFSQSLLNAGIKPGDMITLVMPNTIEFVIAFLAIVSIRATSAPLNPDYKQDEFQFFMEDQGAAAVIDLPGAKANPNARGAANALNIPAWEAAWNADRVELVLSPNKPLGHPATASPVDAENDVALFLHTSGTTSRPKGVPLTHKNITASIRNIINTYEFTPNDCTVLAMPLFHVHGLIAGLLSPLSAGSSVYITASGKFAASQFWKDITRWNATWYTAVPTIHQILAGRYNEDYPKEKPPQLRFIRSCSSPLAPSILSDMERKFNAPVLEAYAMTEASHQMSSNPLPKNGPHKPGSVGIGQNVEIVTLDNAGHQLPPMRSGEICVAGANVTTGYRNNPKANAESFAGGHFHTGDLGYIDHDGYLFITGRIKELINRGGEKIAPVRIDEILLGHPSVAEAVAFGAPDEKYGEEVNAAVVLKPGANATSSELTAFCLERLSAFEIPKRYFFAESLPKTGSGKIQRKKVAEHFLGNT